MSVIGGDRGVRATLIGRRALEAAGRDVGSQGGARGAALEALRPGVRCAGVDRAVRRYYEANDLMRFWKHHTGHAIGLRYHEGPFLDVGDETEIRPGMVFTVEPGLYVPDIGGFRHSDTVAVTESGIEILTYYSRDLESLIIPAD